MFPRLRPGSFAAIALVVAPAAAARQAVSDWSQLTPLPALPQRSAITATFDPVSHRTVVFGGYDAVGYRHDTFVFDGQSWAQVNTPISPSRRAGAAMCYDSVAHKIVLFGGFNGSQYLGDTWLWDGATLSWTQASPALSPTPVSGPMMFTDPVDGHANCYGGFGGMFYQFRTWQWTGSTWVDLNPSTSPFARGAGVVATDARTHTSVLFGGLGSLNPWNTWVWDGSDWTQMNPSIQPPNRYYAGAAFDPNLQSVVIFGGGSGGVDLDDTWRWTGSDWEQLLPLHMPPARESFGMVFDPNVFDVLVIGGEDQFGIFGDTWGFASPPWVATFCTAGTTSSGCVASIGATGVASASSSSGFQITATHVEGQRLGIVFYGIDNFGFTPTVWGAGGTSYLCVKAPTQRTGVQVSGGSIGLCDGVLQLDWNAYRAAHPSALGAPLTPGQTIYAQTWFRDPPSPKTTSLSNALEFVVQP